MSEHNSSEATFNLQRVYTKDISFEAPNSPYIFQQDWQPAVNLELDVSSTKLADDIFEVVLRTTVTVKIKEETAFLCEVQQAGLFHITGLDNEQLGHCIGSYCPNLLFPYARECVSSLVTRGTFPHLNIAPMINFDALYMQQLQKQAEAQQNAPHQDA